MPSLYETDFSRWVDKTAKLLAEKRFSELDLDELIEEVQDLAGRHRDAYESRLQVIIEHLLKLTYAPDPIYRNNERGWRNTISQERDNIERLLHQNAGAARDKDEARVNAFKYGLREIARTRDDFGAIDWPQACPWTLEQLLDPDFFPAGGSNRGTG